MKRDVSRLAEFAAVSAALALVIGLVLHRQIVAPWSVPDLGDPLFSMWRLGWVAHQVSADPRQLFDANIFYPERASLTYSDSMILPGLMAAPLLWAGVHPVLAYNLLLISGFLLSSIAAYALVRGLGLGREAGWCAALIFGLYPSYRLDHFSHLELQMAQWIPLALLAIHLLIASRRAVYVPAVALLLAAQSYSSMYYGVFLALYAAVFAGVLMLGRRAGWRTAASLTGAFVLAAALVLPLARAYMASQPQRGVRDERAVKEFSAESADYLKASRRLTLYGRIMPGPRHEERQLFPGGVTLTLAAIGAFPPFGAVSLAAIAAGAVAFEGSLGFNGFVYPLLYQWIGPFRSLRVPARFGLFVGISLAVLAAVGTQRMFARVQGGRARGLVLAAITAALIVEAWPSLRLEPSWREPPAIYATLHSGRGSVLAEFPVHGEPERFAENIPYMYFSMWHWTPMVNGYSGFQPASYAAFVRGAAGFPGGQSIDFLSTLGVSHVGVHCALWDPRVCAAALDTLDRDRRVRRVAAAKWHGAQSVLYEMRR